MDASRELHSLNAMRAYVLGESSEPVVISAFREVPFDDRAEIVSRHRGELEAIDGARALILESMLVPLDQRRR